MSESLFSPVDDDVARLALDRYGLSEQRTLRMINLSENATYLMADPGTGREGILRVHRVDYHDRASIESELDWLTALGKEAGVSTPRVIHTTDGDRVVSLEVEGHDRHAVLFEVVPGIEPDEVALDTASFETLGAITARMHRHARTWKRPPGFARFSWDWEHSLGEQPRWGRWHDGIGVGPGESAVLGAAASLVQQRLAEYGQGGDRFGLVHADLRLANLLVDDDQVNVIDFDDCGFSWFMYDFGTAVSFIEHDPRLPEWQEAWLRGYRSVEELSAEHEEMLATFVMLRRLLLVAWMGSHSHSRECQDVGPGYTASSLDLARRYVASGGSSIV
ncbi:Ser/Thr protein kinase RdoA (MazF antagonist) [Nocardioides daedukensis]|uniref:Ser/Thr protein kinase RdoA (MazF antagonist) n=1 Tax=Nocardioides daedukensis TaxID=634462 RepID=A0A7Y9RXJ1_9ACTN|nr:phosphotransferase [Nocardioides daedukensis]NYG57124.1 Ser/Thr protein kinase RdoA (MazF antagonist) [Nocardioides daedukensis]